MSAAASVFDIARMLFGLALGGSFEEREGERERAG